MELNETVCGVDKSKRYGWTIVDKPGVLMEIDKRELVIDHEYQRSVRLADIKVKKIAAEWSWVACGAIIVGMRGGTPYVIDGQHRVMAAMKLSAVSKMPCVVFETDGKTQEAEGFIRANRHRKPMSTVEAFKALTIAGDPVARKAAELIKASGRTLARNAGSSTFSAPGGLLRCLSDDEPVMRAIWPLLIDACKDGVITQRLIEATFYVERNLASQSLTDARWRAKFVRVGGGALTAAIHRSVAFHDATGPKIWARGIVELLNKGMRDNRLELRRS